MKRLILLFVFLLSACNPNTVPAQKISPFTFINQDGFAFGSDQLSGDVWVANFIFTSCDTVCQPMTAEMAVLQKYVEEKDVPIQLISFSVDPKTDTPEVLHNYIQDFTDDLSNWNLLTGYQQKEIEQFAREQFNTIVQKPSSSSTQVIHGTYFYLIDGDGHLLGEYNFVDPTYKDELLKQIEKVLK